MRSIKLHLLLMPMICMSMIDVFGQSGTKASEKATNYLKKFRSDYRSSMLNNKPELLQVFFAENIRLMPPFQKTIIGKVNALSYHKSIFSRFTIQDFTRNEIEILDLGSQVLETGILTLRLTSKETGKEEVLAGKYLNFWEEMKNGELLLITDAWNYDQYYGEIHEALRVDDVPSVHLATQPNVFVNSSISFELAALNRLLDATVTQHDANIWSQYYTDDAILMASNHRICQGKESIDEYIKMHVKELPVFEELDIRNDRIDHLGTFVIEYASHIASWKNGNSSGVSMGKNIRIWRREADHSLKLFRAIGMYD
jgi:ketosteroid isomerase-like protein